MKLLEAIKIPFRRYKQLHRRKQLVVQAATFITVFQIFANVLYVTYPTWTFTWIEWNGVAFGMITSIAACYYALYGIWHSYILIDKAKEEIYSRLGVPFIKGLIEFGRKVDKRWGKISPEQQASILSKTEMIVDRLFSSLGKDGPKPERKKVKELR